MQMMKQISYVGVSVILTLFAMPGWSWVPSGQQGESTPQQSAGVQPKEAQPQEAPLAHTAAGDSTSQSQSVSGQRGQSSAQITESVQEKPTQQSTPPLQQQRGTQGPGGTAAAESQKTSGVAASSPSGVAIAPAKQHRRRAFWVKVGAIMGAGVAVGTTFALSRSSSGRPPGSH